MCISRISILYQRGIYPPETFDRRKKYGLTMLVTSDEGLTSYLSNVLQQISSTCLHRMIYTLSLLSLACVLRNYTHQCPVQLKYASVCPSSQRTEKQMKTCCHLCACVHVRVCAAWLMQNALQSLVIVITGVTSKEVLERWTFNIENDENTNTSNGGGAHASTSGRAPSKPEKEIMGEIQAIIRQITASVTFLPLLEEPCTFDLLVYTKSDSEVPSQWEESDPRYITNSEEVRLRAFTTKVHKVNAAVAYRTEDE